MNPKLLLLLPLAACPTSPAQPTLHALRKAVVVPVHEWPERRDLPEKTEPPHGEGSGDSPMYGGLAAYGTASVNVFSNVSATATVYSSASGVSPDAFTAWLPNRFPLILSIEDFHVEPFEPSSRPNVTMRIRSDTTKHLRYPSTIQTRRAFTRRRS
jgi:hypothetical protein